jgi:hypothetical protein
VQILLEYVGAERTYVPYYSGVRWLSFDKFLKTLWDLQEEIIMFLGIECETEMFPKLKDEN